ncbi:TetR/AcrR family transcriptional regulator [Sphingomonas morindae]|uniref:TetR/AcrR family transcriptional regulator n=1 Tax=Sphingomonas morindae TaxID=1541170 RepID=A0ABY4X7R1_9SPHN|nr:TetR/AcrR family transcriptional regulator [Sphingomonas morindae]USI72954.1 TetR/AcrR family transcriptional regulator [Sphingomonas morindae]
METDLLPHPGRGRPREFCVDQALGAALRVFWQRGYEGASLSELTEAMGITRPSLYAAFGNKESLFRKALDLYEREKLSYIQQALAAPTAREVADRLIRGALDKQGEGDEPKGCLSVVASLACAPQGEALRKEVVARRAAIDAAILARFERAKAEGDIPEGIESIGLARMLGAFIQGLMVQASSDVPREQLCAASATLKAIWPSR